MLLPLVAGNVIAPPENDSVASSPVIVPLVILPVDVAVTSAFIFNAPPDDEKVPLKVPVPLKVAVALVEMLNIVPEIPPAPTIKTAVPVAVIRFTLVVNAAEKVERSNVPLRMTSCCVQVRASPRVNEPPAQSTHTSFGHVFVAVVRVDAPRPSYVHV